MEEVINAKGLNGFVSFDGQFITISRKGFLAVASFGKSEKRIPVSSITAVQFKPPSTITNGFMQFTIPGGVEQKSIFGQQGINAARDENTVVFLKKSLPDMQSIRDAVEQAIIKLHLPQTTHLQQASTSDELTRLAQLHEQGVLSDDEFTVAKSRILEI